MMHDENGESCIDFDPKLNSWVTNSFVLSSRGNKHVVGFSDLAHSLLLHMQRPPVSFLLASQGCIAFINYQEYYATPKRNLYRIFHNMM